MSIEIIKNVLWWFDAALLILVVIVELLYPSFPRRSQED